MRQLEAAVASDTDTTRQFQEFRNVTAQKFDQLNATVGAYQVERPRGGPRARQDGRGAGDAQPGQAAGRFPRRGAEAPAGAAPDGPAIGAGAGRHCRPARDGRGVLLPDRRHLHHRAQRGPPGTQPVRAGRPDAPPAGDPRKPARPHLRDRRRAGRRGVERGVRQAGAMGAGQAGAADPGSASVRALARHAGPAPAAGSRHDALQDAGRHSRGP